LNSCHFLRILFPVLFSPLKGRSSPSVGGLLFLRCLTPSFIYAPIRELKGQHPFSRSCYSWFWCLYAILHIPLLSSSELGRLVFASAPSTLWSAACLAIPCRHQYFSAPIVHAGCLLIVFRSRSRLNRVAPFPMNFLPFPTPLCFMTCDVAPPRRTTPPGSTLSRGAGRLFPFDLRIMRFPRSLKVSSFAEIN